MILIFSECKSKEAEKAYDEYECMRRTWERRMATDLKCNLPFLAFNNINTNKILCPNQSDVAGIT